MDRGLKERLVGAAVLVALAVIFIPMLLDDSPSGPGPITSTNIPERPDAEDGFSSRIVPVKPEPVEVELPESRPADDAAAVPPAEPAPQPAEPGAEAPESDAATATEPSGEGQEPALTTAMPAPETDTGKPSGWVIQLGSFSQETNARELDEKLRKAGYPAFVEPVTQSGKRVYRVRVGPEVMRGDAEKVRDKIAADFDIKGIVVSYP